MMLWLRTIITIIAAPFVPIVYLNIEVLAESLGWDALLLAGYPVMTDLLTQSWVFALASFVVGMAFGVWVHWYAAGKTRSGNENEHNSTHTDPVPSNFEDRSINLDDFFSPSYRERVHKRFLRCDLTGNIPIVFNGHTNLDLSRFRDCDLIIIKENVPIHNAIGFRDSSFIDCTIHRVTIYLSRDVARQMIAQGVVGADGFASRSITGEDSERG